MNSPTSSRSNRRRIVTLLLLVTTGYALVCALLTIFQERLIYFPGGPPSADPGVYGLDFEELRLVASDGVELSAWLCRPPATSPTRGAVVVSHGNAGNIGNRLHIARVLVESGFAALLYDYRGYGLSSGEPGEEGTYLDALAAHEALVERGFEGRIAGYGESLGGAVTVELALRRELRAVCLQSSFRSLPAVAAEHYPWLPVRWLVRHRYASEDKIDSLAVPLLVLHGRSDRVVPYAHGKRLAELAAEPKQFVELPGGHNDDPFADPAVREALQSFLSAAF